MGCRIQASEEAWNLVPRLIMQITGVPKFLNRGYKHTYWDPLTY